jgi:hypothetical protein
MSPLLNYLWFVFVIFSRSKRRKKKREILVQDIWNILLIYKRNLVQQWLILLQNKCSRSNDLFTFTIDFYTYTMFSYAHQCPSIEVKINSVYLTLQHSANLHWLILLPLSTDFSSCINFNNKSLLDIRGFFNFNFCLFLKLQPHAHGHTTIWPEKAHTYIDIILV